MNPLAACGYSGWFGSIGWGLRPWICWNQPCQHAKSEAISITPPPHTPHKMIGWYAESKVCFLSSSQAVDKHEGCII